MRCGQETCLGQTCQQHQHVNQAGFVAERKKKKRPSDQTRSFYLNPLPIVSGAAKQPVASLQNCSDCSVKLFFFHLKMLTYSPTPNILQINITLVFPIFFPWAIAVHYLHSYAKSSEHPGVQEKTIVFQCSKINTEDTFQRLKAKRNLRTKN